MQNNKRYWLRGGIIAVLFQVLIAVLNFLINSQGILAMTSLVHFFYLPYYFSRINESLLNSFGENLYLVIAFMFLLPVLESFLAGTIIGWLYGKIKNRKFSS